MALALAASDDEKVEWERAINDNYKYILATINPVNIKDWLRQKEVITANDEEIILHQKTTQERNVTMLDIVRRRSHYGMKIYLDAVGYEYPEMYTKITKKEPPTRPDDYYTPSRARHSQSFHTFISNIQSFLSTKESETQMLLASLEREHVNTKAREDRIIHLEEERDQLRLDKNRLFDSFMKYESNTEKLQEQVNTLNAQLEESKKANEDYAEENKELRTQVENTTERHKKATKKSMKLQHQLTTLEHEEQTRQIDAARNQEDFPVVLADELSKEKLLNEELQNQVAAFEGQVSELEDTICSLKSKLSGAKYQHQRALEGTLVCREKLQKVERENHHLMSDLGKKMMGLIKALSQEKLTIDSLEKNVNDTMENLLNNETNFMDTRTKFFSFRRNLQKSRENLEAISTKVHQTMSDKQPNCERNLSGGRGNDRKYRRDQNGAPICN